MLRSAAKNFASVTVVVDPADYGRVLAALQASDDDLDLRRLLAEKVFAHTAAYDAAIAHWFAVQRAEMFPGANRHPARASADRCATARIPGQRAAFYVERTERRTRRARAARRQGAVVQQPARPRGRAARHRSVRRRDRAARSSSTPRRAGSRPARRRSRRTRRRSRAIRCRRSAR